MVYGIYMTNTTYTYPQNDFSIVGAFYVAYEGSHKSGSAGIAYFSPIAIPNESLTDDEVRLAAYDHAARRAARKFRSVAKRADKVAMFVASGDNDRQRFTTEDVDAVGRFVAQNDLRVVEGVTPRWFVAAVAGILPTGSEPVSVPSEPATEPATGSEVPSLGSVAYMLHGPF